MLQITETIAAALRTDILQGSYKSNAPLRQDEIAARFGVSKIPVREALQQLKAEGLVTFFPNRGAVVSTLSSAEVDEIYAMRIALRNIGLATRHSPSNHCRLVTPRPC
ncbi:MAG: GntR family transcriptional regulator [Caldilineaceae bacterium]